MFESVFEWLRTSPVAAIIGIVVALALVLMVLKLVGKIAKPLIVIIIAAALALLFFNIIDLATLSSDGEKLLSSCLGSCIKTV